LYLHQLIVNLCFIFFVDLQAVTIATDTTDGLRRYLRSAQKYKYDVKVIPIYISDIVFVNRITFVVETIKKL